ncbi:hypothetical protein [Streptomyces sp. TRM68367]|uniref:hypothetical protein n=1 Tax=Streptomyces sp. TRM68367 TaxID=2758415 RepID=UPI00165CB301|nr:hypothetical protein [Streptomyces sp. TRM68367]MBC9729966.1 hypothetical protein [Streptomyces sp. TRM68367]
MSKTPSPAEQAHARITALVKWLESVLEDIEYCEDIRIYESTFPDPYPQADASTSTPRRNRGERRAEHARTVAATYRDSAGEQW